MAEPNRLSFIDKICSVKLGVSLCLGQILSLCLCGTAVTSGILGERGVIIPTAQSFLNYVLLCLVYTTLLACRKEGHLVQVLRERGWKYGILALADVEANYLIVKAYHYTTVTSVQLLDCLTIPTVLLLSCIFLRVRYSLPHFLGVGVAMAGVGILVLADYLVARDTSHGVNKLLGDFLCLLAAILYGVSNVGQEYVVKSYNRVEFLGMVGLFGSIINGVQFAVLERREVASLDLSQYQTALCLLGFALCLFTLYSLMPVALQKTSATLVNLNLLSADFYALLVGLFIFKYKFHWLYFLSFVLILLGLLIYSVRPVPEVPTTDGQSSREADPGESQPLCQVTDKEGGACAVTDRPSDGPNGAEPGDSLLLLQTQPNIGGASALTDGNTCRDIDSAVTEQGGVASTMIDMSAGCDRSVSQEENPQLYPLAGGGDTSLMDRSTDNPNQGVQINPQEGVASAVSDRSGDEGVGLEHSEARERDTRVCEDMVTGTVVSTETGVKVTERLTLPADTTNTHTSHTGPHS